MQARIGQWPTRHLFDVRIDASKLEEVLHAADHAIASRGRLLVGVVNAAKLVRMARDEQLRRAVIGADVVLADGMSVVWACRLLWRRLPERVAGIDLMTRLLERANQRQYRVYCLGARESVISSVADQIRRRFPGVQLVGARNGYFTEGDESSVANEVASARPDILFVGMTSPKKEHFIAQWAPKMNVPVCHGVGGAFDVLAGVIKRAPVAMQRAGLEWLYRVAQEPKRLGKRYVVTNTLFALMVARECGSVLARRLPRRRSALSNAATLRD